MVFVMLVAGIGLVLAGLLAIAYGIGVQLSTGNTMIIAGVIGVCTGMIMLGFWTTVRELKNIARQLGNGLPEARGEAAAAAGASRCCDAGCRPRRWRLPGRRAVRGSRSLLSGSTAAVAERGRAA